jgi:hypothetical protein
MQLQLHNVTKIDEVKTKNLDGNSYSKDLFISCLDNVTGKETVVSITLFAGDKKALTHKKHNTFMSYLNQSFSK